MNKQTTEAIKYTVIFILLLTVLILYVYFFIPVLTNKIPTICNLNTTGEIGDTIGGLTAPIIGLFSAFLVYIAFKSQIDANKKQHKFNKKQSNFNDLNIFLELEKSLSQELEEIHYNIYHTDEENKWYSIRINGVTSLKYINNRLLSNANLNEYSFENLLKSGDLRESEIINFFRNILIFYSKLDSLIEYFNSCEFDKNLKNLLSNNIITKYKLIETDNIESYNNTKIDRQYDEIKNILNELTPKIQTINSKIVNLKS